MPMQFWYVVGVSVATMCVSTVLSHYDRRRARREVDQVVREWESWILPFASARPSGTISAHDPVGSQAA